MSFYTCFDWFKELFVNERNLKIDVVLKASCASFSLNEAPLGFISDYFPYFEKNKYIFQYHNKKKRLN